MLAKMESAKARVRIQEQLDGLSVDAEVKALDNVRTHIKNTIAAGQPRQGAGRVVARLAARRPARAVGRGDGAQPARRAEGEAGRQEGRAEDDVTRADVGLAEAAEARPPAGAPAVGRGAAPPLPARRGQPVHPPRQRLRPGRARRRAAAGARVPDRSPARREQGRSSSSTTSRPAAASCAEAQARRPTRRFDELLGPARARRSSCPRWSACSRPPSGWR